MLYSTSKQVVTISVLHVTGRVVDDGHGGSDWEILDDTDSREYKFPRSDYASGREGVKPFIDDLVKVFTDEGVTFAATGNDWAAQPDGPSIISYASDEMRETTVHFEGYVSPWIRLRVMKEVG